MKLAASLSTLKAQLDQEKSNDLLAKAVLSIGTVIGSSFLACDELLRTKKMVVVTSANFINDCWLQLYKHSLGYMLASACLTEEGVEGLISANPPPAPMVSSLGIYHQAGCHVLGSRARNRHSCSEHQPGQRG